MNSIDNLDEVIEHLDLAFFRGYSVAQPIWTNDTVRHIEVFDSWNFLFDERGALLWNPNCSMDVKDCETIGPSARLLYLKRRRAIDWPALIIYLRKYIGERDWGRFLERYGIPPVDVVMAANATKEDRSEYEKGADAANNGQNVVWPANSQISRSETSRGQDPFSAFIDHQEREIVLMATGGTLTSLAQADTGALAGGAQMKVWEQIVARDAVLTNAVFARSLINRFLALNFPGREIAAKFELGPEKNPSPAEVAELAGKIKSAGYLVDQHALEEATGFKLVKDETPSNGVPFLNKRPSPDATARGGDKLLAAFASDMSPLGDAIKALLNDPSPAAATALIDRLPSLLPDDPALASILAEAMAEEFGVTLANSGTSEGAKKGWETRLRNGWTPKQLEDNKKAVRALAEKAISDRQSNETIDLGTVNGEAVSDIKRKTGIDVTGFKQTISSRDLRHADNRHGSNGETNKGQVPLTIEDYERIPELFSNYDRIEKGSPEKNTNLPSIRFIKKYDDGTLYGVDVIVEKDKTIRYKTGWKDAPQ